MNAPTQQLLQWRTQIVEELHRAESRVEQAREQIELLDRLLTVTGTGTGTDEKPKPQAGETRLAETPPERTEATQAG